LSQPLRYLAFEIENNGAVLIMNRCHFIRLYDMTPNYGGIMECKYDPDFQLLTNNIHEKQKQKKSKKGHSI
jgi:hypothetical protein